MENLGDGAGKLYFITFDCDQGYHQIRVWYKDQDKLALFATDSKKYTFTVILFGPLNVPLFYTVLVLWIQAKWIKICQLCYNNPVTRAQLDDS